jgi:hypothetical protein
MADDNPNSASTLPSWLRHDNRLPASPAAGMPDPGKLPALSYYERHPEHRPRRPLWRRSIRQRLSEI